MLTQEWGDEGFFECGLGCTLVPALGSCLRDVCTDGVQDAKDSSPDIRAFLWLKHQSDYIQHFPACRIQPRQTVQHFSEHPCSTASWYPILFSPKLVGVLYCLGLPFYVLWKGTYTAGVNQSTLSSTHHPSPWPVTKTFRQSVQEQDELIADTSLFASPSFQCASAASPCNADRLCLGNDHTLLPTQPVCQQFPLARSRSAADQHRRVKQDIV